MIFDTHAHYDDDAFVQDRQEVLAGLAQAGVDLVMNIGCSIESSMATIALTEQYDFVYGAVGIHPGCVEEVSEKDLDWLKQKAAHTKIKAIGEIGLDYHYPDSNIALQQKWFVDQIELAKACNLPIVVHSRDAAKDTLDIMQGTNCQDMTGVVHCYSYSKEQARDYLNMGFYFGIGGVATFKNGRKMKDVVEYVPLESILLETDCPYLAPEPFRGKRNASSYLPYVAEAIAQIKGITAEQVIETTAANGRKLFNI